MYEDDDPRSSLSVNILEVVHEEIDLLIRRTKGSVNVTRRYVLGLSLNGSYR